MQIGCIYVFKGEIQLAGEQTHIKGRIYLHSNCDLYYEGLVGQGSVSPIVQHILYCTTNPLFPNWDVYMYSCFQPSSGIQQKPPYSLDVSRPCWTKSLLLYAFPQPLCRLQPSHVTNPLLCEGTILYNSPLNNISLLRCLSSLALARTGPHRLLTRSRCSLCRAACSRGAWQHISTKSGLQSKRRASAATELVSGSAARRARISETSDSVRLWRVPAV